MSGARTFTELKYWQRAREWGKQIFRLTRREAFRQDRRLVEQINDSTDSVTANIAEGFGRGTQGEFVSFLATRWDDGRVHHFDDQERLWRQTHASPSEELDG